MRAFENTTRSRDSHGAYGWMGIVSGLIALPFLIFAGIYFADTFPAKGNGSIAMLAFAVTAIFAHLAIRPIREWVLTSEVLATRPRLSGHISLQLELAPLIFGFVVHEHVMGKEDQLAANRILLVLILIVLAQEFWQVFVKDMLRRPQT